MSSDTFTMARFPVSTMPLDTNNTLGVKCSMVEPEWRRELADLAARMIGPHPRYAILRWDGTAFYWQVCNTPQRIHVDEMTREQ